MTARRALMIACTCMVLGRCGPASPNPDATNPGAGQGNGGTGAGGSNSQYGGTTIGNSSQGTKCGNGQRLKSFSLQSFIPWNDGIGQGSSTAPIPLSPNTLNATEVTASNFVLPYAGRWVLQISATANGTSDVADIPFFAN